MVIDLAYANSLASEHGTEVDLGVILRIKNAFSVQLAVDNLTDEDAHTGPFGKICIQDKTMHHWPIKVSLFLNYFVFAILLNSVGIVILQVQNSYGVTESSAAVLEAFKDLSIAITSFLIASFVVRIGYKRTMLGSLGFIGVAALLMPQLPTFWMAKLMFAATGIGFALVKVSVFATLGLVTRDSKEHVSTMNFLESFFMVGVLSGYFIFSYFVDDLNPGSTSWLNVYYT